MLYLKSKKKVRRNKKRKKKTKKTNKTKRGKCKAILPSLARQYIKRKIKQRTFEKNCGENLRKHYKHRIQKEKTLIEKP